MTRCPGSHTVQMVDWMPDDNPSVELDGKPYPGASVCISCNYGILLIKGSVHPAVSGTGFEGFAGTLRVHSLPKPERKNVLGDNKRETTYKNCSYEGCENKLPNHAWGRIKAEGWFQQRDGNIWCPDHIPEWVEEWRKKRDATDS